MLSTSKERAVLDCNQGTLDFTHYSTVDPYRFTSKPVVWLWVSIQRNITGLVMCQLHPLLIS